MPYTEKAGTSLPPNCPELEQFVEAQAHCRAARIILDELSVHPLPQLTEDQRRRFKNICNEEFMVLVEVLDAIEDLQFLFFGPLYPVVEPLNS